jgi:glycosyltransferase involved in cell wall biosynthesis
VRVMYLSASGQLGGAETSLLEILASLRDAQPSWTLHLLVGASGPLEARAAALGVATETLHFGPTISSLGERTSGADRNRARFAWQLARAAIPIGAYIKQLRRAIQRTRPDILHSNGLKMHVLAARADAGPKLVWHLHDYLGSRSISGRLLRWNHSRSSLVLANSQSVAGDARAALNGTRVVPLYNAIDLARFSPAGDCMDLDALAAFPPASSPVVRIGLLGTFARWKGHATYLNALARVPRKVPIRAYVIGDAVYETEGSQHSRAELEALVRHLGIGDRVGFTGFVTRPEAALRSLDVVVHASTSPEPFGLVIVEAMATARAVVMSLAGGAAEIVTPGVDALGHVPGDVDGLAARITELVASPELRTRLGRAARLTAERSFDRGRLARDLVPIYQAVLGD